MMPLFLTTLLAFAPSAPVQEAARDEVWDLERMREVASGIQQEIEVLRGLEFERPVRIELADQAAFLAYARRTMEADGGLERMRREEEVSKLLGLLPGDLDLLAVTAEVLVEQVGGFYDPKTETFYVMASLQADLARVVIAHEFTHALDDQHFDLDGTKDQLTGNADAAAAYHAVIEGSGMELMFEWVRHHMEPAARARMLEAQSALPADALGEAPPAVWKPLVVLYYQGQAFLRRQRRASPVGSSARMSDIDRALTEPPRSTEQVIHPLKYWSADHRDEPRTLEIDASPLPEGTVLRHENTLGELYAAMITTPFDERGGLSLDMGELLGLRFTNDAASGWGGDRYALLERDDARVLCWETRWDSLEDADEFAAALSDLSVEIEAAKARAAGHDAALSGLHIERRGSDEVSLVSWTGLPRAEALELAGSVQVLEKVKGE